MGSGSLNAMAVFEDGFQEDLDVEGAKNLVARAIKSGIYNDLGSGSNVDLCIIYKDKVRRGLQLPWRFSADVIGCTVLVNRSSSWLLTHMTQSVPCLSAIGLPMTSEAEESLFAGGVSAQL
jgi:hypothetical protein